jgi:hypothetical protein
MLRSILAVLFGVIAGAFLVFLSERVSHMLFPIAAGFDPTKPGAIAALPFGAKAAVVIAWFAGAFGGGGLASLIARRWAPAVWVVAATILLFAMTNFSAFPHPLWMVIASAPAAGLGGYLAVRLTGARYGRPPVAEKKSFP